MECVPHPFEQAGFAIVPRVLPSSPSAPVEIGANGTRCLLDQPWCRAIALQLCEQPRLQRLIPSGHVAVQCTYFEKSPDHNWLVALHQDLSIPVAARVDSDALRGWSRKEGRDFVQAPAEVLAQLVAVRVHIDPCGAADGALRVVPGSHRAGILDPRQSRLLREARGEFTCALDAGDALVMRPLLLHASSKSSGTSRRRVLHFLFGPRELPHGLQWPASAQIRP